MPPRIKPRSAKPKLATKRGGARPGAGRKPAAATVLRQQVQAEGLDAAQEAFDLMVTWMRDDTLGKAHRIACAIYIQDRVLGKPTTSIQNDANLPMLVDDLPE